MCVAALAQIFIITNFFLLQPGAVPIETFTGLAGLIYALVD